MQQQDSRLASPSDHGHSSDFSQAPSSQEPYYSNEDITALHAVVAAAQELLDTAPDPKPLPAAALFKAYDDVLPRHGIDPDMDHHLSALVFRIGGEQGGGTLIDKFQNILARMGIVLEFGDHTTLSFRSSSSPSPSSSSSRPRHTPEPRSGLLPVDDYHKPEQLPPPAPTSAIQVDIPEDAYARPESDDNLILASARRAAMSSVLGRWRAVVAKRQYQENQWTEDETRQAQEDHEGIEQKGKPPQAVNSIEESRQPPVTTARRGSIAVDQPGPPVRAATPREQEGDFGRERQPGFETQVEPRTEVAIDEQEENHRRSLKRAARAREIYLASKVFNHWADRTARRLERDAVARRHMIRFRCFRGWSQVPSSREPAVDQMKAIVAIKKWQHSTLAQAGMYRAATEAAAQTYRSNIVRQALERWACHRTEFVARQRTDSLLKAKAISTWKSQASSDAKFVATLKLQAQGQKGFDALDKWRRHAEREDIRAAAASGIGSTQRSYIHLREWWDQAEIGRRTRSYRQHLFLEKAGSAFTQWNLQARAQAFIWRREYLSVSSVFDKWCGNAAKDKAARRQAESSYNEKSKSHMMRRLIRLQQGNSHLSTLGSRACLFLGATRLLDVFETTLKRREDREKEQLKRRLMARYTQMSSSRKRRNFLAALDRWRSCTDKDKRQAHTVRQICVRRDSRQLGFSLAIWAEDAADAQQRHEAARLHHGQVWVVAWSEYAQDLEQRDMDAWHLWAVAKQRHYVKEWSMSSLHQSGQAHTASKVRQRYDREKRNQRLQQWRKGYGNLRGGTLERISPAAPRGIFQGSYRMSWRSSTRRPVVRRPDDSHDYSAGTMETPTRWTGQALPMSEILPERIMPPLRELDEDDAASSTSGVDAGLGGSPSSRFQGRRGEEFSALPSTTPRAPVPSHLERNFQGRSSKLQEASTREAGGPMWRTAGGGSRLLTAAFSGQAKSSAGVEYFDRPGSLRGSSALTTRSISERSNHRRPTGLRSSLQAVPREAASLSMGENRLGSRYASPRLLASASASRSVRIQSPKSSTTTKQRTQRGLGQKLPDMRAVLPGKPQSRLQGLASGYWDARQINTYITGSAFAILDGSRSVIQTIYDDDEQPLEAISIDEASGKIATCTSTKVRVYKPFGSRDDALKWALESSFDIPLPSTETTCVLSWGSSEELLVATGSLSLFVTSAEPKCSWRKKLPSPAKLAALSYDSAYIASSGQHDNLVKVWRRLTYGSEEVRFDLSYLRHPDIVTLVRWRKPFHIEAAADNVLDTVCLDGFVRVWTPTDTPDGKHWRLWGRVNVCASPQNHSLQHDMQLVFFLDGRDFTAAVERAVEDRLSNDARSDDVAIDHLVAVANRNPEICIVLDGRGSMSAWAFENVTISAAASPIIFNIAQVHDPHFKLLGSFLQPDEPPHIETQIYCDRKSDEIHLLLHAFDGRIGVFTSSVADLFDPTTNDRRLSLHTIWSGHSTSIKKIVRNFSGRAVVSRTAAGESIVWKHVLNRSENTGLALTRGSVIPETGHIHRICVLRKGRFVVFLHHDTVTLWDCRCKRAVSVARCAYRVSGKPLCLIILPRQNVKDYTVAHIATVTSEQQGVVWKVKLPPYFEDREATAGVGIQEFCRFELKEAEGLAYVLPVDPAGSSAIVSGFLDIFARDVAISYSLTGRVEFWTARIDPDQRSVGWLSTCSTETGLSKPALVSGSTLKKAALVNSTRSQVTIWDVGGSRLEYEKDYKENNVIQDLDWTSTPDSQSILAVGFQYRVILLSQMRFDYLNKGPAWAQIREISIRELTPHPIGDSTWLGDGHLVIGAGNQMFVQDRQVGVSDSVRADLRLPPRKEGTWDLFEVVQRFNGPLPIFHPQFLSQCILCGKTTLVRRTLVALHKLLKYHIDGETIDDYLGMNLSEFYTPLQTPNRGLEKGSGLDGAQDEDEDDQSFTEQTAASINEKLTKVGIPQLSGHEQIQLADIIECVSLVEQHRRSMDENGARFMLFFRQHALRKGRTNEMHLSWREINWAYHSNSQDILVDFVSRQNHGSMLWEHARESGIFMWLSDNSAVKAHFELIARNEYTKNEVKNPVDCSLFYLALRKKAMLQGLWRMASWNKEQGATQRLLANNFDDPKWKTAALKNAYALLSKRRFAYAAAFFLLADHLHDAVEVCLNQLKDMQLAIAVARVYEGDSGPVFRKLLQDEVLPLAAREGNRWLASWAFWMLGRKDMSVRALITPVYTLLETPCSPDIKSRLFLTDDPALVVLYSHLRHQTLQTLRGASKVTPKVEWEFVLHSAKLYDRMGCDLLGLDLVRNWEFQRPAVAGLGGEVNTLKLLRRRSSLVVADLPSPTLQFGMRSGGGKRPQAPPTTFEEPESSSLLDSFGF
ncbi:hypothetical protein G7046_g5782 [Stylonectria norvegica]|nr:hypothetical protein G7046_g5782 [Stylonectria norvegica]